MEATFLPVERRTIYRGPLLRGNINFATKLSSFHNCVPVASNMENQVDPNGYICHGQPAVSLRPNLADCLVLYDPWAKSDFYNLKWLGEKNNRVILCAVKTKWNSSFSATNKISLEHSCTDLFTYCLWLLLCYSGRGCCNRCCTACKD